MFALGGSNYLAAIIGLFGVCYEIVNSFMNHCNFREKSLKKNKGYFCLLIGVILELAGLYISYISPGNNNRSGSDMSFRPKYFLRCIWWSIDRARILGFSQIKERPIIIFYILVICLVIIYELSKRIEENGYLKIVKHPLLSLVFVNGCHFATYMPEVYSASDVSSGVPNTHFEMILLVILCNLIVLFDLAIYLICKNKKIEKIENNKIQWNINAILCVVSVLFFLIVSNDSVKTTNDYCKEYIKSGLMNEYENVWWKQYEIYTDDSIKTAVVPEVYDDIYPACHMAVSNNPDSMHNINRMRYYEKESVVGYDYKECR